MDNEKMDILGKKCTFFDGHVNGHGNAPGAMRTTLPNVGCPRLHEMPMDIAIGQLLAPYPPGRCGAHLGGSKTHKKKQNYEF